MGLVIADRRHHERPRRGRGRRATFGASLEVLERPSTRPPPRRRPAKSRPFKTEAEKDEAIVKSLTDFRAKHTGTKAAVSAALPLGQALLRQGKPDQALPLVDEYLAKTDGTDPLRPAAYEARGYALEAQKKYDDALNAFDLLAKENKTDFMKGMGLYHRAPHAAAQGRHRGGREDPLGDRERPRRTRPPPAWRRTASPCSPRRAWTCPSRRR